METEIKCETCKTNLAKEEHTCPFKEDVRNDCESKCNCCDACERECLRNI